MKTHMQEDSCVWLQVSVSNHRICVCGLTLPCSSSFCNCSIVSAVTMCFFKSADALGERETQNVGLCLIISGRSKLPPQSAVQVTPGEQVVLDVFQHGRQSFHHISLGNGVLLSGVSSHNHTLVLLHVLRTHLKTDRHSLHRQSPTSLNSWKRTNLIVIINDKVPF